MNIVPSLVLTLSLFAFTPSALSSPVYIVDAGELTAIHGVTVAGDLYDVTFLDGTARSIWPDSVADFANFREAEAAAAALAAVLNAPDALPAGVGHDPSLVAGIDVRRSGMLLTTFGFFDDAEGFPQVNVVGTTMVLFPGAGQSWLGPGGGGWLSIDSDLSASADFAYARFQRVPEPSTTSIVLAACAAAAAAGWQRRRRLAWAGA